MSRNQKPELPDAETEIVEALKVAGGKGLSTSALVKNRPSRMNPALRQLEKRGEIGNLGSRTKTCYLLLEGQDIRSKALEMACRSILAKALPGKPKLLSKSVFEKDLKFAPKTQLMNALSRLVQEKKLIPIKYRGVNLYLHPSALGEYFPHAASSTGATSMPPAIAVSIDRDTIRAAYDRLVERTRYLDIKIANLQAETAIPIEALKIWLLEECRGRRVIPGKGEYTLATDADRAAALSINGQPHLYVKFVS